jgi:hypothetical protein
MGTPRKFLLEWCTLGKLSSQRNVFYDLGANNQFKTSCQMENDIWITEPEEHDFPAALDFLDLLFSRPLAEEMVARLRARQTVMKKAKDILRASELPLLPKDNIHVKNNLQKVKNGKKLSPILLIRDSKLLIADGYHRLCSIYYLSEDLQVPCRIADKSH